ncbi:collagen alpha-1(I) chain-like [Ovis aries]|uniref:collagen alpha-1(I) chain-like n=1 Tax=Ovis aries TaxID=9940 RepID=UPI0029527C9D|nr:collagen alpha-1(I) chain-like [Ovis aries]
MTESGSEPGGAARGGGPGGVHAVREGQGQRGPRPQWGGGHAGEEVRPGRRQGAGWGGGRRGGQTGEEATRGRRSDPGGGRPGKGEPLAGREQTEGREKGGPSGREARGRPRPRGRQAALQRPPAVASGKRGRGPRRSPGAVPEASQGRREAPRPGAGAGEGRAGPAGSAAPPLAPRIPAAAGAARGACGPRGPGASGAGSPVRRLPGPSSASRPTPGRQGRVSPPPGRRPPPCGAGGPPCSGTRTPGRLEDTAYRPVRLLGPTVFEERVDLPLPARKRRRRRWHPTPVILPGKSHGRRSLVGCSPWGRTESDTTERLHFHFSLSCIGEGNGTPLQCSCLENARDGGARWEAFYGVAQSRTRLKRLSSSSSSEEAGLRVKQDSPPRRLPKAAPLEASEELLKGGPDPALGALLGVLEWGPHRPWLARRSSPCPPPRGPAPPEFSSSAALQLLSPAASPPLSSSSPPPASPLPTYFSPPPASPLLHQLLLLPAPNFSSPQPASPLPDQLLSPTSFSSPRSQLLLPPASPLSPQLLLFP